MPARSSASARLLSMATVTSGSKLRLQAAGPPIAPRFATRPVRGGSGVASRHGAPGHSILQERHMLPARYDPFFSPFHVLKRDMERTFGDFFRDLGMTPTPDLEDTFEPRLDLVETDEGYKLRADLPGVDPRDVKVNLVGNTLTIEGEKREEKEE